MLGRVSRGCRVDGRSAFRAKRLRSFSTAFRGLDVLLHYPGNLQILGIHQRDGAKRRPRERLTIGAVAYSNSIRVDLGFVCDGSTMTSSVDVHYVILQSLQWVGSLVNGILFLIRVDAATRESVQTTGEGRRGSNSMLAVFLNSLGCNVHISV